MIWEKYTIPASSSSGWSTSDGNAKNVQYNNNETYGAYYTWCAATAGTCVNSGTASSSVCPKGWKLPTKVEYDTLKSKDGGWDSTKKGRTLGGGFFPAAGDVSDSPLINVGSWGSYWSSTAYNSDQAYSLNFNSNGVGTNYNNRCRGYSVRCIAL